MEFSEYLAELFEAALDGKLNEMSDEEKRLLAQSAKVVLDKLKH